MEGKFQTSFIPKKTLATATPTRTHSSVSLFMSAAIIVFVLSVLGAGGVFVYERLLRTQIDGMNAQLEEAQKALRPNDIIAWKELDYRIRSLKSILSSHAATSLLFDFLQQETLQRVRFQNFSYKDELGLRKLLMTGQADAYATVALQAEELGKNKYLQESLFEGLNLDEQGKVTFKFSASIDPALLSYPNTLIVPTGEEATVPAEAELDTSGESL